MEFNGLFEKLGWCCSRTRISVESCFDHIHRVNHSQGDSECTHEARETEKEKRVIYCDPLLHLDAYIEAAADGNDTDGQEDQ